MTDSIEILETVTHRLVGWGPYDRLRGSILHHVFGHMVRLTEGVVVEYHGDLFADAETLRDGLDAAKGEDTFTYCVRHSGTDLSRNGDEFDRARAMAQVNPSNAHLYVLRVYADERGEWFLDITRLPVQ